LFPPVSMKPQEGKHFPFYCYTTLEGSTLIFKFLRCLRAISSLSNRPFCVRVPSRAPSFSSFLPIFGRKAATSPLLVMADEGKVNHRGGILRPSFHPVVFFRQYFCKHWAGGLSRFSSCIVGYGYFWNEDNTTFMSMLIYKEM